MPLVSALRKIVPGLFADISISKIRISSKTRRRVSRVLKSGQIASGQVTRDFESALKRYTSAKHVHTVSNGTDALVIALRAAGVGVGDEVITTPFTFIATLNSILEVGATAVLVDIDPKSFNLDPRLVESAITSRTKAILPVHLYGYPADLVNLHKIATLHKLRVIEDCAQAIGTISNGEHVGVGDIGTFSLYATKNVATGEGGFIATAQNADAEFVATYRNQGMASRYEYTMQGVNSRLTDLCSAIGLGQLGEYETNLTKRSSNAHKYMDLLQDEPQLILPNEPANGKHSWHQFTLMVSPDSGRTRDEIISVLSQSRITAGVYYPRCVHEYDVFRNHQLVRRSSTEQAESISKRCFSIPVHQHLSSSEVQFVAQKLKDALRK